MGGHEALGETGLDIVKRAATDDVAKGCRRGERARARCIDRVAAGAADECDGSTARSRCSIEICGQRGQGAISPLRNDGWRRRTAAKREGAGKYEACKKKGCDAGKGHGHDRL